MAGLIEEITERFDLPAETAGLPKVTITGGRQVLVENHKGLLEYSGEQIEINGGRLRVRIRGTGLELRAMSRELVLVTGQIFGVDME